ncbi:GNAT family N-acetyltransferase [Amycolatopsis sp. NPDC051102]|uniref:GNAT family N-acetyltransferase n=1 Tax=Amycolatopsis sp. NPDC051102 TaxID=3155163 RepID=UPI00342FC62E
MTEPSVRPARSADLESFATALGDRAFFAERFERQRKGLGELLLAWLGGRAAGAVYLWLEEAEELPILRHLPGVPLITHLEVHPELRNLGVGKALVGAAERRLFEKGRYRVALAVRTDNHDAARLYDNLGYRDWGHGKVTCYARRTSPEGNLLLEAEECHVLVKELVSVTPAPRSEPTSIRQPKAIRATGSPQESSRESSRNQQRRAPG